MKSHTLLITALLCLAALSLPGRAASPDKSKVHTPETGSVERKAFMDSVRAEYAHQDPAKPPVVFTVPYLKIHGDWAWARIEPQSKDGKQHFEPQSGLFERHGGEWALVAWEPSEEGTDTAAFFKELKRKHPELPADILPKP
jgi:hypothetical protein